MRRIQAIIFCFILASPALLAVEEQGAEPSAGGGLLQQLGIEPKVLLIQIVGFVLLYLLLKRFLFGPIGNLLRQREEEIQSTFRQIEADQAAAERARTELEQRLTRIETEARERMQAVLREAQALREEILSEAHKQAETIVENGRQEIEREKQKALVELREEMANLTILAAGKILGEALDRDRHRRLIEEFIQKVGS